MSNLAEQIKLLREELQKERIERQREAPSDSSAVKGLQEQLQNEATQRQKITNWIRDNLGPNLEIIKKLIKETASTTAAQLVSHPLIATLSFFRQPAPRKDNEFSFLFDNRDTSTDDLAKFLEKDEPIIFSDAKPQSSFPVPPSALVKSESQSFESMLFKEAPSKPSSFPVAPSAAVSKPKETARPKDLRVQDSPLFTAAQKENKVVVQEPVAAPVRKPAPVPVAAEENTTSERRTKQSSKKKKDGEPYYSDEEWSDSDDEGKKSKANRTPAESRRLTRVEALIIPEPEDMDRDASIIPTTARINIDHSVKLHTPIYRITTESLVPKLRTFSSKGGHVLFVPPDRDKYPFVFGIRPQDVLYPICADGLRQSQILYLLLKGLKRAVAASTTEKEVFLPHGAIYGYDVPNENLLEFVHKDENDPIGKCFAAALGQPKSPRFAEKVGKGLHSDATNDKKPDWKKLPQNRLKMKEYFDLYYYRPEKKISRRFVYFAFQQAFPVVLDRLIETNESFDGITLIALPFGDEVLTPPESLDLKKRDLTKEQLVSHRHLEIYKKYASIFRPALT